MKRFILFMIAVFVIMFGFNFDVKALVNDVSIKDVEVVNMTGKPDVIKEPTYKDLAIDLGVRFFDVGDSVTYRITVENKGTSDVYINDVIGNTNSEYFDYTFGFENDDKTVKGKSNKTFNLTVSFKNDIPDEKFSESGKVVEKSEVVIKIGNEVEVKNPNTASNKYIIILIILVLVIVGFTLVMTKYGNKFEQLKQTNIKLVILFVAIALILYLGYSYAIEAINISVNSTVEVEKKIDRKARLARSCASDSYLNDGSGFCLDWTKYVDYSFSMPMRQEDNDNIVMFKADMKEESKIKSIVLLTATSNFMEASYTYNNINYELVNTYDVSDIQNGEIILGVYVDSKKEDYLLIIGQYSGVLAPIDGSSLFSGKSSNHVLNLWTLPTTAILTNLDVSDTINMTSMFSTFYANNLDISTWNFNSVINMSSMFNNFYGPNFKFGGFNLSNVVSASSMFDSSTLNEVDFTKIEFSKLENMSYIFNYSFIDNVNLSGFLFDDVAIKNNMFANATFKSLDLSNAVTANISDMSYFFSGVQVNTLNLTNFNTSNVTDMSYMFANIKVSDLNLKGFDMSNVIDMTNMFSGASITNLNLSETITSNVKKMTSMFYFANIDNLNLTNFDTSCVNDMSGMFYNFTTKKIVGMSFNTSNVTNMSLMFAQTNLDYYNLSTFDTSNVTAFSSMFSDSKATNLDLSNFNTSNAVYMSSMFKGYSTDSLDLSSFNTKKVVDMSYMFSSAKIKYLDISSFENGALTTVNYMFYNFDSKLKDAEVHMDKLLLYKTGSNLTYGARAFLNIDTSIKFYVTDSTKQYILWLNSSNNSLTTDNLIVVGS